MYLRKIISLIMVCVIGTVTSCNRSDSDPVTPGQLSFSFKNSESPSGGRTKSATPAFVHYSVKHESGLVVSNKVEVIKFNDKFISEPIELITGNYQLIEFLVLGSDNASIYAAPIEGSPLADLVEDPLPLPFTISTEETTALEPEVLAVEDHEPEEFGYATLSFIVVEKIDLHIKATIADYIDHDEIPYTMVVTAKDAPLGTTRWTKTYSLNDTSRIEIPARFNFYTFQAQKNGYIDHLQYYSKSFIPVNGELRFEFIPTSLAGFTRNVQGAVTFYYPDDANRCKLYTRVDVLEGFSMGKVHATRQAEKKAGLPVFGSGRVAECADGSAIYGPCSRINLFFNLPYRYAIEYCDTYIPHTPNGPLDPATLDIMAFTVVSGVNHTTQANYFNSDNIIWH